MSWWDTTQFTSLASNAIKNAQKKIDKVLDIPTEDDGQSTAFSSQSAQADKSSWSSWGSPSQFLPSTPKSPTFEEPISRPSLTAHSPKPSNTSLSTPPVSHPEQTSIEPLIQETVASRGEGNASSPPSTPRKEKAERRRAARQRSSEKAAPPKKLGAVKLTAVKRTCPDVTPDESALQPSAASTADDATSEGVPSAGDPTSASVDPTSASGDPTSSSGDPTSASGDPTSASGDPQVLVDSLQNPAVPSGLDRLVNSLPEDLAKHAEGTLSADAAAPDTLAADTVAADTVAADTVASSTVAADTVSADTVAADTVALDSVAAHLVASGTVEADTLAADNVAADTVAADIVAADLVASDTIATYPIAVKDVITDSLTDVVSNTVAGDVEKKPSPDDDLQDTVTPSFDGAVDESLRGCSSAADVECANTVAEHNEVVQEPLTDTELSKDLFTKSVDSDVVLIGVEADPVTPRCADNDQSSVDSADWHPATGHAADDASINLAPTERVMGNMSDLTTNSASSEGTVVEQVLSTAADGLAAAKVADTDDQPSVTDSMTAMEQSTCSENSYVKCELPTSFNNADSASEFRRRAASDFSLPSLTDLETATSSDIEIISMPSTYGDGNGESRMMDFVPLSRSVFKTRIRNMSPDEEMSASPLQLSPGSDKDASSSSASEKSGEGQREMREAENSVNSTMIKKVSQLTAVLEARENKLVSLSREHSELLEVNAHLKRRIEQMEETNGDLNLVKSEFGQRLHDVERKLHNALREKELVKKQYLTAQEELHNRIGTSGKMQRIVEDKDEQISSLLAEGEKLAKQQLTSNNLIKKLRKKEKEQEELSREHRDRIDSQSSELERLRAVLDSKIQNEGKHSDLIKQLNSAVSNYQTELAKVKSEAEDAVERQKRAESAVDNSYKEIAELHKSLAAKDAEIRELKLGNEAHMKEELQMALDRKHKEALRDADHLTGQIEDMQLTISRMEKDQNRREECLRQEKQDLLDRLNESDKRNDELTQSVAAATKPLLRQIENLQSSYSTQSMSWERVEKNLTDRLADAQSRLATATEKERQATESAQELSSRVSILESQLSSVKQEKSKLMAEVEVSKMRIPTLQDERNSAITQLDTYKANMEADISEMRKSQTLLENKLELEKTKLEAEKKRHVVLLEQLQEKDQQLHEMSTSRHSSTPSPIFAADEGKVPAMKRSMKQDELLERALSTSTMTGSTLYDSMRNHSTTSMLESLESQVKQREGEIVQLQADISEHEKTRESLTKEMVKLTEENGRQESKIRELSRLQQQYKELNGRYQALLQMYGEKEEQVTELRMDLMDVKQMYKQQIDVLMSK